jgi:cytochrome d ubiquinol oxidase subunit II
MEINMFENLSLYTLQQLWWIIISLLGGLFVFLTFIQGGQTLLNTLAKNDIEKSMLINSLGRKWELGFTTLVLFGGALFAAFPLFYATSFGGAYWVWLAILFCFIIQAVSYEYRKKPNNFLGQKTYETFLYINGSLGVILIGTALSTMLSGAMFSLNEYNFVEWHTPYRGLEAVLNPYNFLLAFSLFFLARITASAYFINNIDHKLIQDRARKAILINTLLFLPFFLGFVAWMCLKDSFAYDLVTKVVYMEPKKHLSIFLNIPLLGGICTLGVIVVLGSIYGAAFTQKTSCIKPLGVGIVLSVTSILANIGLDGSVFYPSLADIQSSLTIQNASSSKYTLTVMSYVALLVPFVLAYIAYVWYAMDKTSITEQEIANSKEELY